ncbi:MAG: hypothetical protein P3W87_006780, partial [Gammaproteobacteria bacterium]|nr:hypothetical protein [Gammaproteobacteria bacterium]
MAVIDAVAYGDSVDGRGTEYLQNANGIFNVHSDHGDGHSHGGSLDRGLNLRGVELGLRAEWEGVLDGAFRFATDGKA